MQKSLFLSVFILLSLSLTAQPVQVCTSGCTGNLGENIFPDGDFGTGVPNVVAVNPGIAPGYGYTTAPPPNDGSYTITNNTGPWGSFAATNWINTLDNGPETNGYMMVVNAAYSPGLFYTKTVDVCANTLYEMSVDVISMIQPSLASSHIKSNVAFLIDGADVCSTGDIPHDGAWKTHRFSFTTGPTTTQVKLSFRNNAPGGYGNDLAIDNISFRACGPKITFTDTIPFCDNAPILLTANVGESPYNTPVYQWQVFQPGGNWADIPGATGLSTTWSNPQDGIAFRLVAANSPVNLNLPYCRSVSNIGIAETVDLSAFAIGGTDTIVCNGAPGVLDASGPFAQYEWSTGNTTATAAAPAPGWYSVMVTTPYGCTAEDSLYVFQVDLNVEEYHSNPLCFNEATGAVEISNRTGGVGPLRYILDGGQVFYTPEITGLTAGPHTITVIDSIGCKLEFPFELSNPPPLTINLGPDQTITACETITFSPETSKNTVAFSWSPADSLSCSNCPAPSAMPLRDMEVTAMIVDELGCRAADSILISVIPRLDVYAPNVFNFDPLTGRENTFFTVFTGKSAVMVDEFSIFDRWGDMVFQRKNSLPMDNSLHWDGLAPSGKVAAGDVFVWQAVITFSDGIARVFRGDVLMLK